MFVKITLQSKIWNAEARKSVLNKALTISANNLQDKIVRILDKDSGSGKVYRVGSLTARRTAKIKARKAKGRKTRSIVGGKFHRASAPGEPPAKNTGKLQRSVKVRRIPGQLAIKATVDAPGAAILDDPERLDRPYFETTINAFVNEDFNDLMRSAIKELTQ